MSVVAYYQELAHKGEFDDRLAEIAREDAEDLVAAVREATCGDVDRLDIWLDKAAEQVAHQVAAEQEEL